MESSNSLTQLSFFSSDILIYFRPVLAVSFALILLFLGWFLVWKLVLVHMPLVQEMFGLRKKHVKPKPENRRRLTQLYKMIDSQNSSTTS